MYLKYVLLFGVFGLSLLSHTHANTPAIPITIIDLNKAYTPTTDDFVKHLAQQDYVILGEYHDSKAQHDFANWLLTTLHQKRPQGSLLLEMLTVSQQAKIDAIQDNPPLPTLKKSLDWQKSWDWGLYGQLVAQPFANNYKLVATNLDKSEVKTLMQGAVPLNGVLSTTPAIKHKIATLIKKNHGMTDTPSPEDEKILGNMVEIQQFRDRRMAQKLLSANKPALLLTGNYHADKTMGVPVHLTDLVNHTTPKPTLQGVVVMMVDKAEQATNIDMTQTDFVVVME